MESTEGTECSNKEVGEEEVSSAHYKSDYTLNLTFINGIHSSWFHSFLSFRRLPYTALFVASTSNLLSYCNVYNKVLSSSGSRKLKRYSWWTNIYRKTSIFPPKHTTHFYIMYHSGSYGSHSSLVSNNQTRNHSINSQFSFEAELLTSLMCFNSFSLETGRYDVVLPAHLMALISRFSHVIPFLQSSLKCCSASLLKGVFCLIAKDM